MKADLFADSVILAELARDYDILEAAICSPCGGPKDAGQAICAQCARRLLPEQLQTLNNARPGRGFGQIYNWISRELRAGQTKRR